LAAEPPLDCLITAMHGREDRSEQQELIEEGPSAAEFSFAEFAGEPFFTNTARTEVLAPVRSTLVGWSGKRLWDRGEDVGEDVALV
jgi:surfactin synthase thioesterase subunit